MKKMRMTVSVLIFLLLFSSPVFAKMMNGKISAVDSGTRKLTLQTTDVATGSVSESEMWINGDAVIESGSLETLKPGDTIWVEAEQDPEGNLKVSKVTKA
jgi:hypothetical protein